MKITLKDGSVKEYEESKSVYEIARDLSEGLARMTVAGQQRQQLRQQQRQQKKQRQQQRKLQILQDQLQRQVLPH